MLLPGYRSSVQALNSASIAEKFSVLPERIKSVKRVSFMLLTVRSMEAMIRQTL